jgi:hypothetical protein
MRMFGSDLGAAQLTDLAISLARADELAKRSQSGFEPDRFEAAGFEATGFELASLCRRLLIRHVHPLYLCCTELR